MSKVNIILGPPGTGKTTTLLNLVDTHLAKGVSPNKIGFISFTKKATEEARDRAKLRFGFTDDDLQYFRTIHSIAFKMIGTSTGAVMKFRDWQAFGEHIGIEIKGRHNVEDGMLQTLERGDKLIFIEQLARVRCVDLQQAWEDAGEEDVSWFELDQVARGLKQWKASNGKIDYTDMLTRYHDEGFVPELKVLFVDEAQDLSQLQWKIVNKMAAKAETVYIAGDDDQAIFRWSGADVEHFIGLSGDVKVLDHSYRLPEEIRSLSEGLTGRIENRRKKRFKSNGLNGYVHYANSVDDIELSSGQWLLLVRNGYMVKKLEDHCKNRGIFYSFRDKGPDFSDELLAARQWQKVLGGASISPENARLIFKFINIRPPRLSDRQYSLEDFKLPGVEIGPWFQVLNKMQVEYAEYIKSMLRAGEKLQEAPRVRLSTIHGSKGGESENVALFTDLSWKTYEAMQKFPDDEARCFYVGATRAKKELTIVQPESTRFFQI